MFKIKGISILNNLRTISSYQETRLCGFIIYDETDAVMKRIMNDSNIYKMLDEISGPRWPIFTVYPLQSTQNDKSREIGMSVSEQNDIDPEMNKKIIDFFELKDEKDTPCFVVFCWDDNGNLINARYKIDNSVPSKAEDSLTRIVKTVIKAEANLAPSKRKDLSAYRNAIYKLEFREYVSSIKTRWDIVKVLEDFIPLFIKVITFG